MSDNEEFEQVSSGAAGTFPQQAGSIKKGGYIVLNGRPCKVVETATSKTGKHGHAKINVTALDIFTGKKIEDMFPTSHNVDVPEVSRAEYQLLNIDDDGFASLLQSDGSTKDDLKVPENEEGEKIRADFSAGKDVLVAVLSAMGTQCIMGSKEVNK